MYPSFRSFTAQTKHWEAGAAPATASKRSCVNVAIPHKRGRKPPRKAMRARGGRFILISLDASSPVGQRGIFQEHHPCHSATYANLTLGQWARPSCPGLQFSSMAPWRHFDGSRVPSRGSFCSGHRAILGGLSGQFLALIQRGHDQFRIPGLLQRVGSEIMTVLDVGQFAAQLSFCPPSLIVERPA